MKVGDKIGHLGPSYGDDIPALRPHYPGTVVYIHPERRFFSVAFDVNGYRVRESFPFTAREKGKT